MKNLFSIVFVIGFMLFITSSNGAPDGYCDGKGGDKTLDGETSFWCPLEGGTTDCAYLEPSNGCDGNGVSGGGGGGFN